VMRAVQLLEVRARHGRDGAGATGPPPARAASVAELNRDSAAQLNTL